MAWIDGVGAYLICSADQVSFGGPAFDHKGADIRLMANLSRRHVTLQRVGECYRLAAHSRVRVAGREVRDETTLSPGSTFELGEGVRFRFRIPTALSATAVVDFLSDHRPAHSVDGIVLMRDNCLLGPGTGNHIQCPDWPDSVVLFHRDNQLWCRSSEYLIVDDRPVSDAAVVRPGSTVSGEQLRFRIEGADQ